MTYAKTIGESDVYLFAGITGDLNAVHVNREAMKETRYGERIAHGVLVLGLASTASTVMIERLRALAVSYGYDRVRFVSAVQFGDTVSLTYRIAERDEVKRRTTADVTATNQRGEVVLAARHILHFLESTGEGR